MKNKMVSNLPRYMLLLGILTIGLMYFYPLMNLNKSVYAITPKNMELISFFNETFKTITILFVTGLVIFFAVRKFKIISMILILIYGIKTIILIGIPFVNFFNFEYVKEIPEYNLITNFTYFRQDAIYIGNDIISSKKCEEGQIICTIIFWAMVLMLMVTLVVLIRSLCIWLKDNYLSITKKNMIFNSPRYMLLFGVFVIGLMYLFPLGDLSPSVYANNTTQADMEEGFVSIFKVVTFLFVLGFMIFIVLRKIKFISMIAILLYGTLVITKVGIPYEKYFDLKYVEESFLAHSESNLIMRFTYYVWDAGELGDDILSARRCEVGQEMCVVIFWAMVAMLAVTTVMLIISLFMFIKENSWSDIKEMIKKKKMDFREKIHGIFT